MLNMSVVSDHYLIIQQAFALGVNYEKTYKGCCQCAIAAIQDALEIRDEAVFKAGSGLTAGGGLSCEGSCGGYIGGVMVMSSLFGRRREKWTDDQKEKECAHRMAKALFDKFYMAYGTNICRNIHQKVFNRTFDLKNVSDKQHFEELGAHKDKCPHVVGNAAAWATGLILDELTQRCMR